MHWLPRCSVSDVDPGNWSRVIAPCRSNPSTTVASPNPDYRLRYLNSQGIRGTTEQAATQPYKPGGEAHGSFGERPEFRTDRTKPLRGQGLLV